MKIMNRVEFLKMPEGTLFSKYEPCVFGALQIKGDSLSNDFCVQQIADSVKCSGSDELFNILFAAKETGDSFEMDFEVEGRDGLFEDEQLFAVWEAKDVLALVKRLMQTIINCEPCGRVNGG